MQSFDLLITGARVATMAGGRYGIVEDAAVGISAGRIAWLGPAADLPPHQAAQSTSLAGRWLTPALIDCHTHLVFAGNRADEFEQRLKGASYEDIARAGGGIMSTVNATRAADHAELLAQSVKRLRQLRAEGCATVEVKSGYGLDVETEIRMLEVARSLAAETGIDIVTTFLGAHTVPAEFRGNEDAYVDLVCDEMLPAVHERGLADAVDAYCESIAFDAEQVERLFRRAQDLDVRVKLHADQLSDGGGAALAARFGALSADHLEYTSQDGIRALAGSGTVAVLLPGAFLTLNEKQQPPVQELRDSGVPIALATDCNPGTSPLGSIHIAMGLASRLFGMTPEECLAGVTREAARALGLGHDRGTLEAGKRADLAVWEFDHPSELTYWLGAHPLADLLVAGRPARSSE